MKKAIWSNSNLLERICKLPDFHVGFMDASKKWMYAFLSAIVLLSMSCEKIIDFKKENIEPKIVLYSVIFPDSLITIRLGSSSPVFDPGYTVPELNSAQVKLFIDDAYIESLQYLGNTSKSEYNGDYSFEEFRSFTTAEPGRRYRIEVSATGYKTISSECVLPDPVEILNIDTAYSYRSYSNPYDASIYNFFVIICRLTFKDPPDTDNYYRLFASYQIGNYGHDKTLPFSLEYPVVVEKRTMWMLASEDPLINTGQEGSGNFFEEEISNEYSIFMDELIAGKEYTLSFSLPEMSSFQLDTAYHEFIHYKIELQSITEELYLHLKSASTHKVKEGNFFSEPVLVYSNVRNGLGILGGSSPASRIIEVGSYPVEGVNYTYSGNRY